MARADTWGLGARLRPPFVAPSVGVDRLSKIVVLDPPAGAIAVGIMTDVAGRPTSRFAQIAYTSSRGGFGIHSEAGEPTAAEKDVLVRGADPERTDFGQQLPRLAPDEVARFNRNLVSVSLDEHTTATWHSAPAGSDQSGRPGNVFVHAVLDRTSAHHGNASSTWRSPDLVIHAIRCIGSRGRCLTRGGAEFRGDGRAPARVRLPSRPGRVAPRRVVAALRRTGNSPGRAWPGRPWRLEPGCGCLVDRSARSPDVHPALPPSLASASGRPAVPFSQTVPLDSS